MHPKKKRENRGKRKMKGYVKKTAWLLLLLAEGLVLLTFALPMSAGITNIGAFLGLGLSAAAIVATMFFRQFKSLLKKLWKHRAAKAVIIVLVSLFGLLVVYAVVLSSLMLGAILNTPKEPDAVIVLGCKVQPSGNPSLMLNQRINAAYDYLVENPDIICIVSGGQGSDEPASEAETMKKVLVEKGIEESRIYLEDKSESTKENIELSVQLAKSLGYEISEAAIVTDGFHQYRAALFAEQAGINATAVCALTPPWLVLSYWFREWFALSYTFVFGS